MGEGMNMFSKSARLTAEAAEQPVKEVVETVPVERPSFSKSENEARRLQTKKDALAIAAKLRGLNNGFDPGLFSDDEVNHIFEGCPADDLKLFIEKAEANLSGLGNQKGTPMPNFLEVSSELEKIKALYGLICTAANSIQHRRQSA